MSTGCQVAKFGGTSLADYTAMCRCAEIVRSDTRIRLVVVSAPSGITNSLVKISQVVRTSHAEAVELAQGIAAKIQQFTDALPADAARDQRVTQLLEDMHLLVLMLSKAHSAQLVDELLSFGERLSAVFFTAVLQSVNVAVRHVDARTLSKTDDCYGKANPVLVDTQVQVIEQLLPHVTDQVCVTEGFIGATNDNVTTTLGRGGSDYSAALFAEALSASALQIWTDVNGIYRIDPRIVPHAEKIDHLCFSEAAELATFGAKVLHPASLWPAIRKKIPVYVGSSLQAEAGGTWITQNSETPVPTVRAIALRSQQTLLTIHSLEMFHARGFLAKVFAVFSKHNIGVDLITTSEVSIALTLDDAAFSTERPVVLKALLADLRCIENIKVDVESDLSLVAIIGNHLQKTAGVSGQIFQGLERFNIRLLCHGASQHNLCFLVNADQGEAVAQQLHEIFFAADEVNA